MIRRFILSSLLLFIFIRADAQSVVSDDQWQKLIGYLKNEDWQNAALLSKTYLSNIPKEKNDEDAPAILRYMHIIADAGLMNQRKLSKEQALQDLHSFIGCHIILPGHPVSMKKFGFKTIQLNNNKTDTLTISESNNANDEFFGLIYVVPAKPFPLDDFKNDAGKICRVTGNLKSINAAGFGFPHFLISIDNAKLIFDE